MYNKSPTSNKPVIMKDPMSIQPSTQPKQSTVQIPNVKDTKLTEEAQPKPANKNKETNEAQKRAKIYMDYQATTPVDPRVLDAMLPYMIERIGNPSAANTAGRTSKQAVEKARSQVAQLINADPNELVFNSGATEGANHVFFGATQMYPDKKHIVTTQIEHKCVLETCRKLEQKGYKVTYVPVDAQGKVNMKALERAIQKDTLLVSVMHVNNEIGITQDIEAVARICNRKGVLFHSDLSQSVGKSQIDTKKLRIDFGSFSGHKLYAPCGIGAIFIRQGIRLPALLHGGGQETAKRSGTVSTPLVVALGKAAQIAHDDFDFDASRIERLSNLLLDGLKKIPAIILNGDSKDRFPGCVNVSFEHVEGESLLMKMPNVAVSSGSACSSSSLEPSYVLRALATDNPALLDSSHSSIRFGIGRFTTENEVQQCLDQVQRAISQLRELSPLWEFHQEGIDLKQFLK